ncbi:LysM domain-containing protein [Arthroderma uncinatum]|uniref:LysM domain-containing protein n=1 Tax=Arthroderma uncinatum TaxID=74035 RepID=UPI00144AC34A|nr:LysM domain-containing protein [Arthroderma uncinatum]KAF3481752.1 LysM domain-containing protein [Arthroderma uncinatum]
MAHITVMPAFITVLPALESPPIQHLYLLEHQRLVNKKRLENPSFNKYEFRQQSASFKAQTFSKPPSIFDLADFIARNNSRAARALTDSAVAKAVKDKEFTYYIPPDLVSAARIIAEASPLERQLGNHSLIAAQIQAKYRLKGNDTNTPPQTYVQPNGLEGYLISPLDAQEDLVPKANTTSSFGKRAAKQHWMATITQRGASPFAPSGYKVSKIFTKFTSIIELVWRNVKDYGAKGDGVTDDTAAINRAISEGNRCGENCGSSTIYPAVVYFPPGTYLVSSPIIQYYNTQFLGEPHDYPTILAASSFVGLGVFSSNVYIEGGNGNSWYLNTNNFLRSIKNFKMDIRRTDPGAYVCAIHWQVAQGTSLENIEFYMVQDSTITQQGIYMENGSGGFLSNLTFVGGNLGAYFGNQQFTTSHLIFVNCKTALQVHWDWAWTMQDIIIESCKTGLVVVGGAGGPGSTGQAVGSLLLVDSIIANTPVGISTSLSGRNSTALLVQNTGFFNVPKAITENVSGDTLLPGGNEVLVDSWGFGLYVNSTEPGKFVSGQNIPTMNRSVSLLGPSGHYKENFYTRRRPQYLDLGQSQILDVKALGAKGDGNTDDTAILNSILSRAGNMSSIVYFPHGIYLIKNTLHIPVGSRIIGQVWSQIMATGPQFSNETSPKVAIEVGKAGDKGIIEIQDMMFTVSGPTAGVVLMEWNVQEISQGSAAMWDSHFRVGGAVGSNLQKKECPKLTGKVNDSCKAASLLLHLTSQSSAYLENLWAWVADHDLDMVSQDQIDIYSARGVLIESKGPTWLYATASEHSVLYQYQISNAKNLLLSMIQTESPYFQPVPKAPSPFTTGLFPNDPLFKDCEASSKTCASSWALRVIDSASVYFLGAGLYSWFSDYKQDCVEKENCQDRGVEIEESVDIWFFNLVTKSIIEMVTPTGIRPTYAAENKNGYTSSLLAWVRDKNTTIGVIDRFSTVSTVHEMPMNELCSYCHIKRNEIMQSSSYSVYNEYYQEVIQVINQKCGLSLPTDFPPSPVLKSPPPPPICVSENKYTTQHGDTCDSIALAKSISSAGLVAGNSELIHNCAKELPVGVELCLPLTCEKTYELQPSDSCSSIEYSKLIRVGGLRAYNNWINMDCTNLHPASEVLGKILCLAPQAGTYTPTGVIPAATPTPGSGYATMVIAPPQNATIAAGTTFGCGKWYTAAQEDTCATICISQLIPAHLFWDVNPSLSTLAFNYNYIPNDIPNYIPNYILNETLDAIFDDASYAINTDNIL